VSSLAPYLLEGSDRRPEAWPRRSRVLQVQDSKLVRRLVLALVLPAVVLPVAIASGASAARKSPLVYVANPNGAVTAYSLTSTGRVKPVRSIPPFHNADSYWGPWGIAVGSNGTLFVQTFLSDATTFAGATRPSRIFMAPISPDLASIAVDGAGYEYVLGSEESDSIAVMPPGASGRSSDLYGVKAVRTFQTGATTPNAWPSVLATDPAGEIIAAVQRSKANAIEVFKGGRSRSDVPRRIISGRNTDLGSCSGSSACSYLSIACARSQIYVAVSAPGGVHLVIFALDATGDARPVRTIAGPRTGFDRMVATGIAVDPASGLVFVLTKTAQFGGHGEIEVFGSDASGNVAPIRKFTDFRSRFANSQGIAIG
jgi:hypothetical protein